MTHPGILKINEFFNNKLFKNIEDIKVSITYKANFLNLPLFQSLRKIVKRAGYIDVNGQIDTLYCIVDGIKSENINSAVISAALSGNEKSYLPANWICTAFYELLKKGKISFDDRIRRDILMCIYLDSTHVNFKTAFLKLDQQKKIYDDFMSILVKEKLIQLKFIEYKIESADLYQKVYDNSKQVISNMNSRGMSLFAIACYFWYKNKHLISTPFMKNWQSLNFINGLVSTILYEKEATEEIKDAIAQHSVFWTIFSELSLLTGRVQNIDKNRKKLNEIINKVLEAEGEDYIKRYLKRLKLVQSSTPLIQNMVPSKPDNIFKDIDKNIREILKEKTTPIPSKEEIINTIKYQFIISKIASIDFSSKRKDHLILDKTTRQRIFEV